MNQLVVVGDPIVHSLTPMMYNAAFKALGLENRFNCIKLRMKTIDLSHLVDSIRIKKITGANITIPHKVSIMSYLDELTPEAKSIKAVNVVYEKNRKIIGHNTDGLGFLTSLKEKNVKLQDQKAVIIGAGGVARAAAFTLAVNKVEELVFLNRTVSKAYELAESIKKTFNCKVKANGLDIIRSELLDADILINCTPVGMKGDQERKSLVTVDMLHPHLVVVEMVYQPIITELLRNAKKAGANIIDGSRMFLYQGAASFELLVGVKPPIDVMEKTLYGVLK